MSDDLTPRLKFKKIEKKKIDVETAVISMEEKRRENLAKDYPVGP
jgi:hypothetical protein